jgi:hypothetical protein
VKSRENSKISRKLTEKQILSVRTRSDMMGRRPPRNIDIYWCVRISLCCYIYISFTLLAHKPDASEALTVGPVSWLPRPTYSSHWARQPLTLLSGSSPLAVRVYLPLLSGSPPLIAVRVLPLLRRRCQGLPAVAVRAPSPRRCQGFLFRHCRHPPSLSLPSSRCCCSPSIVIVAVVTPRCRCQGPPLLSTLGSISPLLDVVRHSSSSLSGSSLASSSSPSSSLPTLSASSSSP